jgi:hypothetical protein
MTETIRRYTPTLAPQARRGDRGFKTKLAIATILGIGIGFYVGRTLSHEPISAFQPGAAAGPISGSATGSRGVGDDPGYLPNQITNQAKDIEPLPPTF